MAKDWYVCGSVGDIMAYMRADAWWQFWGPFTTAATTTVVYGSLNGCVTVEVYTDAGYGALIRGSFIIVTLPTGHKLKAREFAEAKGFNGCQTIDTAAPPPSGYTIGQQQAYFSATLPVIKESLVNNLGVGGVSSSMAAYTTLVAGKLGQASHAFLATDPFESVVCVETGVFAFQTDSIVDGYILDYFTPTSAAAQQVPSPADNSLVAAVKQIADADFDISFNHGQSVFSVRSKLAT